MEISAYARGVLALLGAKSLGVGFGQAADYISPSLDMERWLGAQSNVRLISGSAVANLLNGLTVPLIQVPATETWVLRGGQLFLAPQAGGSLTQAFLMALPPEQPGSAVTFCLSGGSGAVAALGLGSCNISFPGMILTPGTQLGTYAAGVVGNVDSWINIYAERYRV
jgi:hypothetical protein